MLMKETWTHYLGSLVWFLNGASIASICWIAYLRRRFRELSEERRQRSRQRIVTQGLTPKERSRARVLKLINDQLDDAVTEIGEDGRRTG